MLSLMLSLPQQIILVLAKIVVHWDGAATRQPAAAKSSRFDRAVRAA
jgi:hypothetical protein